MKRLVSRGLGGGYPIAKPDRIWCKMIGYNGIDFPGQEFFILSIGFVNYPDSKFVVNLIKGDILGKQLLTDRIDRFHPSLNGITEAFFIPGILDNT
jgi:hypothetical protein